MRQKHGQNCLIRGDKLTVFSFKQLTLGPIMLMVANLAAIRVASAAIHVQPSTGRATLIPGQRLQLQCDLLEEKSPEFVWYRKSLEPGAIEEMLQPDDENFDIRNTRLVIPKPTSLLAGDYTCRSKRDLDSTEKQAEPSASSPSESATIKVRSLPYISEFESSTPHTGRSVVVGEGAFLAINCTVPQELGPINITWFRSRSPDDDHEMEPIPEVAQVGSLMAAQGDQNQQPSSSVAAVLSQTYAAQESSSAQVESLGLHTKRLIISEVRHEHRGHYVCVANNGVTERAKKSLMVRVKDKMAALWPALAIIAELVILLTIIHIWETQRAQSQLESKLQLGGQSQTGGSVASGSGRLAGARAPAHERQPLTMAAS